MTSPPIYLVAVEGGGTSFRVGICQLLTQSQDDGSNHPVVNHPNHDDDIPNILQHIIVDDDHHTYIKVIHMKRFDSSGDDPHVCLEQCCQYIEEFKNKNHHVTMSALGIASFGPIGLHHDHIETYGTILSSSPKATWRNVNIVQPIQHACQLSSSSAVLFDTDVNAPAYSEYMDHNRSKNQSKISSCAYITVGTGVGVGLIINHQPVHGYMHPEGGHVCIQPYHDHDDSDFLGYSWGKQGNCPYYGIHTVEGMTSSIALIERYQHRIKTQQEEQEEANMTSLDRDILKTISDDDPIWDHCINAIANLCVTLLLLCSMEKIVIGGGVVSSRYHILLPKIQQRTNLLLNGYMGPNLPLSQMITSSIYGEHAGFVGAIHLSYRAYCQKHTKQNNNLASSEKSDEHDQEKHDHNSNDIIRIKQDAFHIGLIHGVVVGIIITGLIVKYMWPSSLSSSSTHHHHHRR